MNRQYIPEHYGSVKGIITIDIFVFWAWQKTNGKSLNLRFIHPKWLSWKPAESFSWLAEHLPYWAHPPADTALAPAAQNCPLSQSLLRRTSRHSPTSWGGKSWREGGWDPDSAHLSSSSLESFQHSYRRTKQTWGCCMTSKSSFKCRFKDIRHKYYITMESVT